MSFCTLGTTTVSFSSNQRWCRPAFWEELLNQLCLRGKNQHESGAFLLGQRSTGEIVDAVFYETLDPAVYSRGIVEFDGSRFAALWSLCKSRDLSVIADVHTHPGIALQSESDRTHPMIARRGHVAMIVPNYARRPRNLSSIGVYEYLSAGDWAVRPSPRTDGHNLSF